MARPTRHQVTEQAERHAPRRLDSEPSLLWPWLGALVVLLALGAALATVIR